MATSVQATKPNNSTRHLIHLVSRAFQSSTPITTVSLQASIADAVERYVKFYTQRYSYLTLPGVDRPVPLSRVYVPLQVVDERSARTFESPKTLKQLHRQRPNRNTEKQATGLRSSLDVANQKQYLLLLGEPGYGKSTFLRWLGYEALTSMGQGNYRHLCIPMFIPLRYCRTEPIDLGQLVAEQLSRCGFPQPQRLAQILLTQGQFLLLWDGLDEVPTPLFSQVQAAIEAFVEQYPKNRYVLSCRKAASYISLKRFATVDLAPLNSQQVATLIRQHLLVFLGVVPDLVLHLKNLMVGLGSTRLSDLTWNPLFLVMLCRVYSQTQQLPGNPSAVYREAIDLLLEAVDPSGSNLPRLQESTLNAEIEKALLSESAYQGLISQQLLYPSAQFETQTQTFLDETLSLTSLPDGLHLIQRLIKYGLLVGIEQAPNDRYYSFAHRSLQEYLSARYLAQYDSAIEPVVTNHITDLHWREVFILLAAQVDRSDRLLTLMAAVAQTYINSDRLKGLLAWTAQITEGSKGTFKPVVKRTVALGIALDRALDMTRNLALDNAIDRALNLCLDLTFALDTGVAIELERAIVLDLDAHPGINLDLSLTLAIAMDLKRLQAFPDSKSAWLISRLEALKSKLAIETIDATEGVQQALNIWLKALHLSEDLLQLTCEEAKNLQHYLYICLLMENCRHMAVRVSRKTWDHLENEMLCPCTRE
jgi:hypothetical protein